LTEPVLIGMFNCKWIKEASNRMLTLSRSNDTSGAVNMCENPTSAYQVPVGKKFILLQYSHSGHSTVTYDHGNLWESAVSGTAAGTRKLRYNYDNNGGGVGLNTINTYIEFAAGMYLVSEHGVAGYIDNGIGVECDT